MSENIDRFVRDALAQGFAREEIRAKLLEARWPEDEVATALEAWAEVDFPIPVPRPKPYVSAREAFGYLILFTTLYVSAIALIKLIYQLINLTLPDPATAAHATEAALSSTRWSAAALIIAMPLFLWLSRRSYRAARTDPETRTSRIRKWLTYLTLFVAATALICDLITLVFYLLSGDLTVRFLLKVAALAAVAGAVFGYYLWDLKQDDRRPDELPATHPGLRLFVGSVLAVTVASVTFGLVLTGSPESVRQQRLDEIRVQHLAWIAHSIDRYWDRHRELPPDLETLIAERSDAPQEIRDPLTDALYEYLPATDGSYQLCAVFETADPEPRGIYLRGGTFWAHGPGRSCFAIRPAPR